MGCELERKGHKKIKRTSRPRARTMLSSPLSCNASRFSKGQKS